VEGDVRGSVICGVLGEEEKGGDRVGGM